MTGGLTNESITAISLLISKVLSVIHKHSHGDCYYHKITLLLTFSFHSQAKLFQSTGSPICLMWSCPKKVFLWKKVPSQSLDHPSSIQSKLPLARCHFILSYQMYSTFILWKSVYKMFHKPTASHLRHSQTIQVWSWLTNKLPWVLASPTISVLWINIAKVHCTANKSHQ